MAAVAGPTADADLQDTPLTRQRLERERLREETAAIVAEIDSARAAAEHHLSSRPDKKGKARIEPSTVQQPPAVANDGNDARKARFELASIMINLNNLRLRAVRFEARYEPGPEGASNSFTATLRDTLDLLDVMKKQTALLTAGAAGAAGVAGEDDEGDSGSSSTQLREERIPTSTSTVLDQLAGMTRRLSSPDQVLLPPPPTLDKAGSSESTRRDETHLDWQSSLGPNALPDVPPPRYTRY